MQSLGVPTMEVCNNRAMVTILTINMEEEPVELPHMASTTKESME